ncbi:MAG: hypothetical protein LBD11_03145 [Candidatus Peribacteria bacterium]|jgi:hypothetical protein|nr:hypothetical protein [Candidatus Peribacteria bacterium]
MNYFILYLPKTDEDVDVSGLFDGISNTKIANNEKETPNEELYWSYKKDFDEMGQMFDYQAAGVINNWENYLKEHF